MSQHIHNESEVIGKEPCPDCGSSDNLVRYSDGHAFCFTPGCNRYEPPDGSEAKTSSKPKDFNPLPLEIRDLKKRGITTETCKKWGYGFSEHWNPESEKVEKCHAINIRDRDTHQLIAQKVRFADKTFSVIGSLKSRPLIGSHLWSGGMKLVITEGEIDALSVSQAQGNKYPVVSVPNGADSAKKSLLANIEYLQRFDEVILCFDMDEPGQYAAKDCAESIMSLINVKIAKLPLKDPNEMLMEGRTKEIITAIWNAEEYTPDGLLDVDEALIQSALEDPPEGLPWVFEELTKASNGRHLGEVHTIGAGTGIGKTDFLLQQADYDIRVLGRKVGLFLVENDPAEVLLYLAGKAKGKFYYVPGHEHREDVKTLTDSMREYQGKVSIYDNFGLCDWNLIKARIVYLINRGFDVFYIDHLTALATGGDRDEKSELEAITADIAELAKRHSILIHQVSHLSTPEGKSHEEGGRVTVRQYKGSRSIGYWSHAMYGLERNQQAEEEEERHKTTVRLLKRRKFGKGVGKTTQLKYNPENGLLETLKDCPFDVPSENHNEEPEEF